MQIASGRRTLPSWVIGLMVAVAFGSGCRRHHPVAPSAPAAAPPVAAAFVAGQVVDRAGHPVPEARVLVFPLAAGPDAAAPSAAPARAAVETATDRDGRFRAGGLVAGRHRLLVEAAGFPTTERAPVTAPADGVEVRLDGEGRAIVGRVEEAGAPVPGARVWLGPEGGGPVRETETRAGGGFAFGGLGAGGYALRAARGATASATARAIGAEETAGAPTVRLVLAPAAAFTGRVIDDAGSGLADVEVRIELSSAVDDPLPTLARTGGSGAFTTPPLPAGSYRVSAVRAGSVLRRAPVVDLAGVPPAPPPVVLELVRGVRLAGRVRDGAGGWAAGARVLCAASTMDDLTVQTGPLPLAAEAAALPSGAGRALGTSRVAVADRDGRFAVDDLIPGRYRIEIAHPGAEPFRSDELTLGPGERRDVGVLALHAGLPAAGRVVDESGAGVEGARVVASPAGAPLGAAFALTDAAGKFALALPAGDYRLAATAPGRGGAQVAVTLRSGTAPPPVELKLVRAEARLEGLVRDTGGRPLAHARLVVSPADPASSPVGSGSTDVGGHFAIPALPAGDLRVDVDHPDYPPATEPAIAGHYALLTVPFPGGVAGEVRARATGAAITRAHVDAVGPGGAKASAELRKTAAFRLLRLAPGRWRLTVTAPGFRAAEQEVDVAAAVSLGEPSVRDLRVELDPS
jgi:hypothetical protein